jgi:hypothetical protein
MCAGCASAHECSLTRGPLCDAYAVQLFARVAAVVVIFAVLVVSASATESTIYPGVGIGKIKLGMTKSQVERILGRDHILYAKDGSYVAYEWDFATWVVGFQSRHVVFVSTSVRAQRTPAGIGPDSTAERLVKAYPHGICGNWGHVLYLVPHEGGTQTIYSIKASAKLLPDGRTQLTPKVLEVWVRTRFKPLPEFAAEHGCGTGWEKPTTD